MPRISTLSLYYILFPYESGTMAVVWLGVVKWGEQVTNSLGYIAITWLERRLRAGAVRIQEEKKDTNLNTGHVISS